MTDNHEILNLGPFVSLRCAASDYDLSIVFLRYIAPLQNMKHKDLQQF